MNNLKYFGQSIIIIFMFFIFKIIGRKFSILISAKLFSLIGPFFRSNTLSHSNLTNALPNFDYEYRKKILKDMWNNYGKIFAEYMFLKDYRKSKKLYENVIVENQEVLTKIKNSLEPVIFISGHFNNFELMAMHIEKSGIDLAAIYRPLNNPFLNPLMEKIRSKYICNKQIKKGMSGTKEILRYFKKGTSIALMIDQRVSEGIKVNFFNNSALTTTIPAQFVKKFQAQIVPVYIERLKNDNFKIRINDPMHFPQNETLESITLKLNLVLEDMIKINPEQWIWTHNRWK